MTQVRVLPQLSVLAAALALTAGLSLTACDPGGKEGGGKTGSSIAKALAAPDAKIAAEKRKKAEFEKQYAAQKKAKEEKELADRAALIDSITVQPEKPWKDLKKACDGVADSFDEMMKRRYATDAKELRLYYDRRRLDRADVREQCRLNANAASASCYSEALKQVDEKLYEHTTKVLRRCVEKFGGNKEFTQTARG